MRHLVIVALLALTLGAASAFAQNSAPVAPPSPAPFPKGAKVAFIDFKRIAADSVDGRNSSGKIKELLTKKQAEGAEKAKALQANQQKLAQSDSVLSETARAQLVKEIEQQTRENERFQRDAQAEITELQQTLQIEFEKKILPIIEQVRKEKDIQLVLSRAQSGIVSAAPGLDLSADVVKKLDATTTKAATPKP